MSTAPPKTISVFPSWWHLTPHVKHLLIAGAITVGTVVIAFKGFNIWESVTKTRAQAADQALQKAQDQLKAADQARQASDQRYQDTVRQVLASNAALAAQIANRDSALRQGQITLQAAPLSDVAARLRTATGLDASEVVPAPTGLSLSDSGARKVTSQVEAEVVEQADLQDTRGQLSGVQSELVSANGLIDSLRKEADQSKVVLADADKACKTEIAAINAKHNKHTLVYTIVSFAVGAILGRRL